MGAVVAAAAVVRAVRTTSIRHHDSAFRGLSTFGAQCQCQDPAVKTSALCLLQKMRFGLTLRKMYSNRLPLAAFDFPIPHSSSPESRHANPLQVHPRMLRPRRVENHQNKHLATKTDSRRFSTFRWLGISKGVKAGNL